MTWWWAVLTSLVGAAAGAALVLLVRRPAPATSTPPGPRLDPADGPDPAAAAGSGLEPAAAAVPAVMPPAAAAPAASVPEQAPPVESAPEPWPTSSAATISPDLVRLMAVLPGACAIVDANGAVVHASPQARSLDLIRDDRIWVDEILAMVRESARQGTVLEGEVTVRKARAKGRTHVRARVAPMSPITTLVLAEDLSEARRVDAVRRDFVANVSHELKTPVGALSLLAEAVLAASDDPDSVKHFAGRMQIEATRLGALVNDVIDLSRLQGGEATREGVSVSVDSVVSEAVDATRLLAQSKDIEVVRGGEAGRVVFGDEHHLATALRNLVSNAINYSPDHTRVAIAVREVEGVVEVSVTDQGIGIADAEQDRIFERFYRVDPARSRGTGGTGLGLAIVKHVCVNYGGEVTVWSRLGEGSTFTLRLPAVSDRPGAGAPGSVPLSVPATESTQGERVS